MTIQRLLVIAGLLLVAAPAAWAGDSGQNAAQAVAAAVFSAAERETIHQYFLRHPDQLQTLQRVNDYAQEGADSRGDTDENGSRHEDQDEDNNEHGDRDEDNNEHGNGGEHEHEHGHGHDHGNGHGHGWKSRQGGLPPGIAKNLARGKPLPSGIAKQIHPLPQELEQVLPPVPQGYERVMVDGKVLLVDIATQVIHDVISDAVMGDKRPRH